MDTLRLDTVSISSLISDVELIPLETRKECMIKSIGRLCVTEKGFVISSFGGKEKILSFSNDGSFISEIGRIGHGRGEYSFFFDMCANRRGDSIAVADVGGILVYNNSGKFLTNIDKFEKGVIRQLSYTSNGLLTSSHYSGANYQLHLYDERLNMIKEYLPTNAKTIGLPPVARNHITCSNNKVCYCDYYSSTLSVIDLSDSKESIYKIQMNNKELLTLEIIDKNSKITNDDCSYLSDFYFDGVNLIGNMIRKSGESVTIQTNLENKNTTQLFYKPYFPKVLDFYNDSYYTVIPQFQFLQIIKNGVFYRNDYLSELIRKAYDRMNVTIDETSNYVIIRMKKNENS